jgi:hypothetical protein
MSLFDGDLNQPKPPRRPKKNKPPKFRPELPDLTSLEFAVMRVVVIRSLEGSRVDDLHKWRLTEIPGDILNALELKGYILCDGGRFYPTPAGKECFYWDAQH